jgi:hypothetical protein
VSDEKWNRKQTLYQESWNFIRQQESLLVQRVNYFLVAAAFLVAGFVELAANSIQNPVNPLMTSLAVLVGSMGLLISWVFTAMDYYDAQILTVSYGCMEERERKLLDTTIDATTTGLPYEQIKKILKNDKGNFDFKIFVYDSIVAPFKFILGKKEPLAPHTWFVPFFFVLFWLTALSIYCGFTFSWWWLFLIIGLPVLFVAVTGVVCHCKAKRRPNMATKEKAHKSINDE